MQKGRRVKMNGEWGWTACFYRHYCQHSWKHWSMAQRQDPPHRGQLWISDQYNMPCKTPHGLWELSLIFFFCSNNQFKGPIWSFLRKCGPCLSPRMITPGTLNSMGELRPHLGFLGGPAWNQELDSKILVVLSTQDTLWFYDSLLKSSKQAMMPSMRGPEPQQ